MKRGGSDVILPVFIRSCEKFYEEFILLQFVGHTAWVNMIYVIHVTGIAVHSNLFDVGVHMVKLIVGYKPKPVAG